MKWFKLDTDIAEHDKIYALAATLKIRRSAEAGGLSFLWGWAFRFAQDGNIAKYPVLEIMKIMDLPRKLQRIYATLLEVQLLEERDDGVYIRNWEEDRVGDCLKNLEKTKLRYKRKK
ncbi:hypothetical protein AGMMS49975_14710 [Clostridia bacterium]|nr:hypothetical protein AGMMS49975_14710 [Clostridia bacterium]